MNRTIKLALTATLALGTTSTFATNGSMLIGMGAKSRGMAGTAIGVGHGAESALSNPALITTIANDHEISFGGTFFMPDVSASYTAQSQQGTMNSSSTTSASDLSIVPEVSLTTKINDNFYWGVGMWGTAGMGVDYRDASANSGTMNMVTNLQSMQFGLPLAVTANGLSFAVTPLLQYGALDINYKFGNENVGDGIAQDLEFGYTLGLAYTAKGFTVGAVYKSEIEMDFKGQLSGATQPFVNMGIFQAPMSDKLSTPSELGAGLSYITGKHTIAFDYKQIKWSDASGYKDFGWEDQDVYALGYEYTTKQWALRLGYNYASNPISDAGAVTMQQGGMNMSSYAGNALNMFNLLGFPATVESHYAVGGTYAFTTTTSLDMAFTYAPETKTTLRTMPDMTHGADVETTVKHSQTALTLQLNYLF